METSNEEVILRNYSPLRYPGGKSKLSSFVAASIKKSKIKSPIYIEPFAGGAGIALSLLYNGTVDKIVINDYDKAIYSMWRAILNDTHKFINLLETTPVSMTEWYKQKDIYSSQNKRYSVELGFAAFYLNRTNRSGIITAGPIGGYNQTGNYKINARFNKEDLLNRIQKIIMYKDRIHLYNQDVRSFINLYAPKYIDKAFIYFDPPYYKKGKQLYRNFFNSKDHQEIHDLINELTCPWIVTYDDIDEIRNIYRDYSGWNFDLMYSVANSGLNSEILFISDTKLLPNQKEKKKINLRTIV